MIDADITLLTGTTYARLLSLRARRLSALLLRYTFLHCRFILMISFTLFMSLSYAYAIFRHRSYRHDDIVDARLFDALFAAAADAFAVAFRLSLYKEF